MSVERAEALRHVGHDVTFGKGGPGGRCSTCHEDMTLVQEYAVRADLESNSCQLLAEQAKELGALRQALAMAYRQTSWSLIPREARLLLDPPGAEESVFCTRPPPGWTCSRNDGHDGPCAASPKGEAR